MTNCVYELSLVVTNGLSSVPIQASGWAVGTNVINISAGIREWLVAIGAILVAFCAIFSDWVKSFFLVGVTERISSICPHFMLESSIGVDMLPTTEDFIGKVWVEVENCSRWKNASFVRLSVEKIYVRESMDDVKCYIKVYEMHPRNLTWSGLVPPKNVMAHISPRTSEYAYLLSIRRPDAAVENSRTEGDDPPEQSPSPIIFVECERQRYPISGDFQDIIVCTRLTGKTVKTEKVYLQVAWRGKTMRQLKEGKFLNCKTISEEDFDTLRKDA